MITRKKMTSRALQLILLSAIVAWFVGCSEGALVGGECRFGLSDCNGLCVNLGDDPAHCGQCSFTCEVNESCRIGVCLPDADADDAGAGTSN